MKNGIIFWVVVAVCNIAIIFSGVLEFAVLIIFLQLLYYSFFYYMFERTFASNHQNVTEESK